MRSIMKKLLITVSFILLSGTAFGHVPYIEHYDFTEKKPQRICHTLEKSIAVYSYFDDENDLDVVTFKLDENSFDPSLTLSGMIELEDGTMTEEIEVPLVVENENGVLSRMLHIGTCVPGCEAYRDTHPYVAVVGPLQESLPVYEGDIELPFEIGDDEGVYILEDPDERELWYEKFTFKSYFYPEKIDLYLTEPGKYRIYTWEPNGNTGDYVVEIGHIERFKAPELLRTLYYWWWLSNDGEIHCDECENQLVDIDGENPNILEALKTLMELF